MKDFTVNGARLVKDRFIRQNTIKEVIQNLRRKKTGKEEKNYNKTTNKTTKKESFTETTLLIYQRYGLSKNFQ